MKIDINQIDETLATLANKASNGPRPKIVDGSYNVKVAEIEFAKGFRDPTKYRLKVKWEVVSDLEGKTELAGALRNQYISVAGVEDDAKIMGIISPIIKVALNAGISLDRIKDDADDANEILANIASLINKRLAKGETISTKLNFKANPANDGFYINYIF